MVKVYLRKIISGEITLEQVPSLWRKKVAAELEALSEEDKAMIADAS